MLLISKGNNDKQTMMIDYSDDHAGDDGALHNEVDHGGNSIVRKKNKKKEKQQTNITIS